MIISLLVSMAEPMLEKIEAAATTTTTSSTIIVIHKME
jgi:hypothetical protein